MPTAISTKSPQRSRSLSSAASNFLIKASPIATPREPSAKLSAVPHMLNLNIDRQSFQHRSTMASAKTIARPFRTRMLSSPRLGFVCLGCRRPASPAATSDSRLSQLTSNVLFTSSSAVPKVAQPSIWSSIIPKALRKSDSQPVQPKPSKSKEWNPASFFIVIFLLIGSQAIRMIALRNDFMNYSRKADAKIELLREVIERLQKGESVDVERMLGTGDETKEREWEEGMSTASYGLLVNVLDC